MPTPKRRKPEPTAQDVMCLKCGESTPDAPKGRPRLYCSTRCRVAAHRAAAKRNTPTVT